MSKEEKKLRQQNKEKIKQEKAAAKAESKQEKQAVKEQSRHEKAASKELEKQEKQQRKAEDNKRRHTDIKWDRLDNTAHLFPVIAGEAMSNVYRIAVTLKEEVQPEYLQQALDIILPKFPGFFMCGCGREFSGIILKKMARELQEYRKKDIFHAVLSDRIRTTAIFSG